MKKYFILFIFLFIVCESSGQVTKYRSTSFAITSKIKGTETWKDWSPFIKSNSLLVLDFKKQKVTLFNPYGDVFYDIIRSPKISKGDDGTNITSFEAVNKDGLKCVFSVKSGFDKSVTHINIIEGNIMMVYAISQTSD